MSTFIATPSDMVKTRILTSAYESQAVAESVSVMGPELRPQPELQLQTNGAAVLAMGGGGGNNTLGSYAPVSSEALDVDDLLSFEITPNKNADTNPLSMGKRILDQEGMAVLFTGVYERCGGAIPRFGITLGAHEWLEHYAHTVGLLS